MQTRRRSGIVSGQRPGQAEADADTGKAAAADKGRRKTQATQGLFSCFECRINKKWCSKPINPPCARCKELGLDCVLQSRGRGRPCKRRRATDDYSSDDMATQEPEQGRHDYYQPFQFHDAVLDTMQVPYHGAGMPSHPYSIPSGGSRSSYQGHPVMGQADGPKEGYQDSLFYGHQVPLRSLTEHQPRQQQESGSWQGAGYAVAGRVDGYGRQGQQVEGTRPYSHEGVSAPGFSSSSLSSSSSCDLESTTAPLEPQATMPPGGWANGEERVVVVSPGGSVGSAEPIDLAFESLCRGVAMLKLMGDKDGVQVPRARFVWQTIDFLFTTTREVFAGGIYLQILGDIVREAESRNKALGTCQSSFSWSGSSSLTDNSITTAVTFQGVEELLYTPGAAALYCCLVHPDRTVLPGEQVRANALMASMFLSVEEICQAATELRCILPAVLAMLMTRESIEAFFEAFARSYAPDAQGREANCVVRIQDRQGEYVQCLATIRWAWGPDRIAMCFRFWPLAAMAQNRGCLAFTPSNAETQETDPQLHGTSKSVTTLIRKPRSAISSPYYPVPSSLPQAAPCYPTAQPCQKQQQQQRQAQQLRTYADSVTGPRPQETSPALQQPTSAHQRGRTMGMLDQLGLCTVITPPVSGGPRSSQPPQLQHQQVVSSSSYGHRQHGWQRSIQEAPLASPHVGGWTDGQPPEQTRRSKQVTEEEAAVAEEEDPLDFVHELLLPGEHVLPAPPVVEESDVHQHGWDDHQERQDFVAVLKEIGSHRDRSPPMEKTDL